MENLSVREQLILELRYGLYDGKFRTLEEVGVLFNLTRERIRQIESKAFKKLNHPFFYLLYYTLYKKYIYYNTFFKIFYFLIFKI